MAMDELINVKDLLNIPSQSDNECVEATPYAK